MSDFLFGVLCGAPFALPGWLFGYSMAQKRGWKREDELRRQIAPILQATTPDGRA